MKILLSILGLFLLAGCVNSQEDTNGGTKDPENSTIEYIESGTGSYATVMAETERIKMTRKDEPDFKFLTACDKLIVASYDISLCVFEIQNETENEADCVILCEKKVKAD